MISTTGDLWTYGNPDARVITTNGFRKANGECVMGRGCAREARDRYPGLAKRIGERIEATGNHAYAFDVGEHWELVTFPVKPVTGSKGEPGFSSMADLVIIEASAWRLLMMAESFGWQEIVMPRPGAGNGGLVWRDVKMLLDRILDDRFTALTYDRPGG